MDIARLAIGASILAFAVYGLWWLAQKAKNLPRPTKAPDALATFNELVGALKANGKLDDAVQASVIAIREAVAEIAMPLESDSEVGK